MKSSLKPEPVKGGWGGGLCQQFRWRAPCRQGLLKKFTTNSSKSISLNLRFAPKYVTYLAGSTNSRCPLFS